MSFTSTGTTRRPHRRFAAAFTGLLAAGAIVTAAPPAAADWGAMHEPVTGQVTSNFNRCDNSSRHDGIDIGAPTGRAVHAAYKGTVRYIGYDAGGYGNYIDISHDNQTYWTRYAHLSRVVVSRGQWVTRGQKVGEVGSTGASSGPHLHFEVRKGDNRWATPLNMDSAYPCGKNVYWGDRIPYQFYGLPA